HVLVVGGAAPRIGAGAALQPAPARPGPVHAGGGVLRVRRVLDPQGGRGGGRRGPHPHPPAVAHQPLDGAPGRARRIRRHPVRVPRHRRHTSRSTAPRQLRGTAVPARQPGFARMGAVTPRSFGQESIMDAVASRSRRSVLAVPASNPRFIEKARGLDVDAFFLDLEDAVAPLEKEKARQAVVAALTEGGWDGKVRTVRVNDATTAWAYRDVITVVEGAG